jgi:hypothetical protein
LRQARVPIAIVVKGPLDGGHYVRPWTVRVLVTAKPDHARRDFGTVLPCRVRRHEILEAARRQHRS